MELWLFDSLRPAPVYIDLPYIDQVFNTIMNSDDTRLGCFTFERSEARCAKDYERSMIHTEDE